MNSRHLKHTDILVLSALIFEVLATEHETTGALGEVAVHRPWNRRPQGASHDTGLVVRIRRLS